MSHRTDTQSATAMLKADASLTPYETQHVIRAMAIVAFLCVPRMRNPE